ncbi:hypothetical protein KCU88_g911, partial [Aureobasidium melanogenum]
MDIFHALPIMLTPWDETLISRWLNYDRIPWCPINGQSEWIPFMINNAMLLHTNLYCWGMHFHAKLTEADATTFFRENPRILEHKVTAIHLMNRHLSTTSACNGATAVVATDEILAAVSIMANIELGFQSRDEAARHMQGLETLLHMRGGMHCLSGVGKVGALLQRVISWNDMLCVELFGGTLRFPSQLPLGDGGYGYIASDDAVCHLEPLQPRFAGNLQREVEGLMGEIHAICDETQARPMTTLTPADKLVRHDVLLRLERRLCMATRITSVSASLSRLQRTNAACIDEMWRAVACAALMYVHHHVRDHSLHWPQFPALVTQFHGHYSLSVANTQPGGGSDQPWDLLPASLHLWVLAVGSVLQPTNDWPSTQRPIMTSSGTSHPSESSSQTAPFAEYDIQARVPPAPSGSELTPHQSLLIGSVMDLFAGRPSKRKLSLWADDGSFQDPLTIAEGRKQYEAQWYGVVATMSDVKQEFAEIVSLGNPIELHLKDRYTIKGVGKEELIDSSVLVYLTDDGQKVKKVVDRWGGEMPPDGPFAKRNPAEKYFASSTTRTGGFDCVESQHNGLGNWSS